MRDKRFVAEHRGGPLKKEQHRQLINWAYKCAKHILPLYGPMVDKKLTDALAVAKAWEKGKATVGEARKAAFAALAVARETKNPSSIAVARAVSHTVATAHMADHCTGAAEYGLKALASAGKAIAKERKWQDKQLPPEITKLVLSERKRKEKSWQTSLEKAKKAREKSVK